MAPPTSLTVRLRKVIPSDLAVYFEQQLNPQANHMAAFTSKNATDWAAFDAHWAKILADPQIQIRTILVGGQVAGYLLHHSWFGDPEVTYWLGQEYWGQGVATRALKAFLMQQNLRPLYARVAEDNIASRRVLEKCGFVMIGEDKGFSNARGAEIVEFILVLRT